MDRVEAESRSILRCEVGSTSLGINLSNTGDRDEMAVCVEPIHEACGLGAPFEQLVYRTAAERTGQHDAPSEPGDLDLTIYSLRKWLRLALKGNPTILTLLLAPPLSYEARGSQLRELAPAILSRQAGKAYLGYMEAQRQRLQGDRGQMRVHRPDLLKSYGFDTKYACHMLRLGFQGVELLHTGRLQFPMQENIRNYLLNVRNGRVEFNTCLTRAGELETELKDLLDTSFLPEFPDREKVEKWMVLIYLRAWSGERAQIDRQEDYTVFKRGEFEHLTGQV